ncbi:MAG: hypothetical protein KatS3mg097_299 [Candidatus Parcubacteria bacterium]|nr:MAG: hypothetical protein KatS3mg097_299 [Candidatus Parcubacteria bacterium]
MTAARFFALLIGGIIMLPLAVAVDFLLEPALGTLSFGIISYLLDAIMGGLYFFWSIFIDYYNSNKPGLKKSVIQSAKKLIVVATGEAIPFLGDIMPFWTLRVALEMYNLIKV